MNIQSILEKLYWIDGVAGGVWVLLTVLMFGAIFLISRAEGELWNIYTNRVLVLLIAVWLYPVFVFGSAFPQLLGLFGNVFVAALAIHTIRIVRKSSRAAALLIFPSVIWLGIATLYVGLQNIS